MKFTSIIVLASVVAQQAIAAPYLPAHGRGSIIARQNNRNGANRNGQNGGQNRFQGGGRFGQGNQGGNRGGNQGGNRGGQGGNQTSAAATSAAATSTAAATTSAAAAGGNQGGNNNNNNGQGQNNNNNGGQNGGNQNGGQQGGNNGGNAGAGGNNNNDPQTSLTLLPELIGPNLAQTGIQAGVDDGTVASLTSTNNYINFCEGQTITNGQQKEGGSCNPVPMGQLPSKDRQPTCKFQNPTNFGSIPANQDFNIQLAVQNLITGNFVNAQTNYFSAPQQLQGGIILAHSHVVVQPISGFDDKSIPDPKTFTFFKGLNAAAQGGVLSTTVTGGLAAGFYRVCSINTAANHQPAVGPVAQHGMFDDCIYFEAK